MTRRRFLANCALGSLALGGGGYAGLFEPNHLVVERRQIRLRGLEGIRIVVMSDFHLEPFTKLPLIERAVALANALQPDLIVLPGDFVTGDPEPIHALAPALGKLQARLGVFASLGNHDYWANPTAVAAALERAGISVLQNRGVPLRHDAQDFFLAGLTSIFGTPPSLPTALANRPHRVPTIVAMHEPDFADEIAPLGQADLQLSGHSHGGQVLIPFFGPPWLPPGARRYVRGSYQVGDLQLYTSRGIGMTGTPFRFRCPPEITELTLV